MTVRAHLLARLADIEEKKKRNGITAGLIVQHREVEKKLKGLSKEDGEKEYIPAKEEKNFWGFDNAF